MGDQAAIYVQRGTPADKQAAACFEYARRERLPCMAIVPFYALDQVVQMVKDEIVNIVIVAFDSKVARQLAVEIDEHGGQVVYVHPTPGTIHPPQPSTLPDMDGLILRWFDAGRTPHEIAEDLGGDSTDVRAVLRRGGREIRRSD